MFYPGTHLSLKHLSKICKKGFKSGGTACTIYERENRDKQIDL